MIVWCVVLVCGSVVVCVDVVLCASISVWLRGMVRAGVAWFVLKRTGVC